MTTKNSDGHRCCVHAKATEPDPLMTIDEVAAYLALPVETLYFYRKKGIGPRSFRLGKHVRYERGDVYAFVQAQRAAA